MGLTVPPMAAPGFDDNPWPTKPIGTGAVRKTLAGEMVTSTEWASGTLAGTLAGKLAGAVVANALSPPVTRAE